MSFGEIWSYYWFGSYMNLGNCWVFGWIGYWKGFGLGLKLGIVIGIGWEGG